MEAAALRSRILVSAIDLSAGALQDLRTCAGALQWPGPAAAGGDGAQPGVVYCRESQRQRRAQAVQTKKDHCHTFRRGQNVISLTLDCPARRSIGLPLVCRCAWSVSADEFNSYGSSSTCCITYSIPCYFLYVLLSS